MPSAWFDYNIIASISKKAKRSYNTSGCVSSLFHTEIVAYPHMKSELLMSVWLGLPVLDLFFGMVLVTALVRA